MFMFFSTGTHGFPMISTILPPITATIRLALNSSDDGWRKALCREPDEASCWSNQYRTSRASLSIWMAPPRLSLHLSSGKGVLFPTNPTWRNGPQNWFPHALPHQNDWKKSEFMLAFSLSFGFRSGCCKLWRRSLHPCDLRIKSSHNSSADLKTMPLGDSRLAGSDWLKKMKKIQSLANET